MCPLRWGTIKTILFQSAVKGNTKKMRREYAPIFFVRAFAVCFWRHLAIVLDSTPVQGAPLPEPHRAGADNHRAMGRHPPAHCRPPSASDGWTVAANASRPLLFCGLLPRSSLYQKRSVMLNLKPKSPLFLPLSPSPQTTRRWSRLCYGSRQSAPRPLGVSAGTSAGIDASQLRTCPPHTQRPLCRRPQLGTHKK